MGATDEGIAAIAREVADDAVRLARAEIELAKAQAVATVKRLAVAIGLLAGAGVFALLMLIFALGAIPVALGGHLLDAWAWWLLTAAALLVVALLFVVLGLRAVRRSIGSGKELVGSVKEDVAWVKHLTKRNESGS